MRYKARSTAALQTILGSLPDKMPVEVDPDIGVKARTVGELRKVKALPENLAITTPPQLYPGGVIKVGRCNVSTRVSPKT